MTNKRLRTLLLSAVALCICTVLVMGGVYALFSDEEEVNTHLVAGSLAIGLDRIGYTQNALDENGEMKKTENDDIIDLTADNTSTFEIQNAVPTASYEAEFQISNKGTTAFEYTLDIVWKVTEGADAQKAQALASQLQVTVSSTKLKEEGSSEEEGKIEFMLDKAKTIDMGHLLKGNKTDTFKVKVEFVDDDEKNNSAMSAEIEVDIKVVATQKVDKPESAS